MRAPSPSVRAVAGVVAAAMLAGGAVAPATARTVTIGGPFELTAADGATVTDATYGGDWLLVFFGYTFCPDVCPTTLMAVADALEKLGGDAERLQPIFITVDPTRDTPDVMGTYTAAFDERIVGLTGTPEQIAMVSEAYGAYSETHAADAADRRYGVDHSSYLYIVDPDGEFVRAMDHDASSERIADTLRELIQRR